MVLMALMAWQGGVLGRPMTQPQPRARARACTEDEPSVDGGGMSGGREPYQGTRAQVWEWEQACTLAGGARQGASFSTRNDSAMALTSPTAETEMHASRGQPGSIASPSLRYCCYCYHRCSTKSALSPMDSSRDAVSPGLAR